MIGGRPTLRDRDVALSADIRVMAAPIWQLRPELRSAVNFWGREGQVRLDIIGDESRRNGAGLYCDVDRTESRHLGARRFRPNQATS